MPAGEAAEAVPIWSQIAAGVLGFLSLCGMIYNGFRVKKEEGPPPASHIVLETASAADTRPFRDRIDNLITATDRVARSSEELVSLQRQILESNDRILDSIKDFVREERDRRRDEEREELHEVRFRDAVAKALKDIDRERR